MTKEAGVHAVVVNDEGAHSIWPGHQPVPGGWRRAGFTGSSEECLAHIGTVWSGEVRAPGLTEPGPVIMTDAFTRSAEAGHRLDRLLMAAAARHPGRIALTVGDTDLTYGELAARAERLAAELRRRGAGVESFVAVAADRSIEAVVGLLGVTLSGAAYVPLDPEFPRSRLRETVRRTGARLGTGAFTAGLAEELGLEHVPAPTTPLPPAQPLAPAALTPGAAAYAIFTSGSTGKPKGVVISHRAIVNSTTARFAVFPWQSMTYLMLAPLTFDAAAAGLYFTLAAGGRLIMPTAEQARDPGLVTGLVARHHVTHLDGVPSQYAAILEFHAAALKELRCVVVAGEALSQGLVRQHAATLPDVPLFNEYGPTESTVWSTCHRCDPADEGPFAPIGLPVGGVEVEVVNEDLDLVAPGETGEIAVSGRQLARGYLGQPELTAAKFLPHPRRPGRRIYLTGDRGRMDEAGHVVYRGRLGSMVKVRGFRVEIAEVEGWLKVQPDVVDAVVLPEQFAGTTRLVAVVVKSSSVLPGAAPSAPVPQRALPPLRARLAEHLPAFMVPSLWRVIERMPLTVNGKIDRAAAAVLAGVALTDRPRDPEPERIAVPPRP